MIRPLHPNDAPSLQALLSEPSHLTCDHFESGADLAVFQSFTEQTIGEHYRLVAIREDQLVGFGMLEHSPKVRLAHVGRIGLLLPAQNMDAGAAAELLAALIDLADNWLNLRRLEVEIPVSIPSLAELVRSSGFEAEGIMRSSLGPGPHFQDETAFARLRGYGDSDHGKRPPVALPDRKNNRTASTQTIIRSMATGDIDSLYEIFRAPENCRTTLQLPSQEIWLTQQRVLQPPPGMIRLVAEYQDQVIGMISMRQREQTCRAHCAGIGMMVHPDFWGQGIGSRLLAQVLDHADHQLGLTRVELQVHTDNAVGVQLYKKHGFVVEGTKRFHTFGDGGWADTYFMARLASSES